MQKWSTLFTMTGSPFWVHNITLIQITALLNAGFEACERSRKYRYRPLPRRWLHGATQGFKSGSFVGPIRLKPPLYWMPVRWVLLGQATPSCHPFVFARACCLGHLHTARHTARRQRRRGHSCLPACPYHVVIFVRVDRSRGYITGNERTDTNWGVCIGPFLCNAKRAIWQAFPMVKLSSRVGHFICLQLLAAGGVVRTCAIHFLLSSHAPNIMLECSHMCCPCNYTRL